MELGNLDSKRDWGFAGDYIKAMWLMLQQDKADDYVIATEELHTIREFLEKSADYLGLTLTYEGEGVDEKIYDQNRNLIAKINPVHFRPTEVELLLGDASKAKTVLKWKPDHSFDNLVKIMTETDYNRVNKGLRLQ